MKTIPIVGKHHGHGLASLYRLDFPRTKRALLVQAHCDLLTIITAAAEAKGIPCIATWTVDGTERWRCHC